MASKADMSRAQQLSRDGLGDGDRKGAATVMRWGLSHLAMVVESLTDAMVPSRPDAALEVISF